jgi:pyruvate/2-oxoglutarate dehydrogenase complex dihydrolipoamide acyltransferase (E2) component
MVDVILETKSWVNAHPGDEEAQVESWLVDEGDHVEAGQLICKASLQEEVIDVAAPQEGVVEQIAVASGERFGPGYILARLAQA